MKRLTNGFMLQSDFGDNFSVDALTVKFSILVILNVVQNKHEIKPIIATDIPRKLRNIVTSSQFSHEITCHMTTWVTCSPN